MSIEHKFLFAIPLPGAPAQADDHVVSGLVEHLESYLGQITGGSKGDTTTPTALQVVWFGPDVPFEGASTISTLGLSKHHLAQPSGKGLHQEILMHFPTSKWPPSAAGVLFQVAGELIDRATGLLRGEVIGPRGRLLGSGALTALYAAAPVYLPDGFAVCTEANRTIVMTWLVPITDQEADFVRTHGWSAFEDALVKENPDLTDVDRNSIAAAC
jgi:hypothetical protein